MLKHGEVNPLNVFGIRQLEFCPPHFEQITFDLRANIKDITDWIYEHLAGRFYIGDIFVPNSELSGALLMQKVVAFELIEEASYFGLFLPNINIQSYNW